MLRKWNELYASTLFLLVSDWYKTCVSCETHHLTTSSRHKHIMRLSVGLMDSSLLKFKLCKFVTTSLGVPKRIRKHCVCSRMVIIKIAYWYLVSKSVNNMKFLTTSIQIGKLGYNKNITQIINDRNSYLLLSH